MNQGCFLKMPDSKLFNPDFVFNIFNLFIFQISGPAAVQSNLLIHQETVRQVKRHRVFTAEKSIRKKAHPGGKPGGKQRYLKEERAHAFSKKGEINPFSFIIPLP